MIARLALVLALLAPTGTAAPRATEQDLIDIITIQPRSPRAPAAALELLDRLNAERRRDELDAWVDRMLAMPPLLVGRDELVTHLRTLQVQTRYTRFRVAFVVALRSDDADGVRAACAGFREIATLSNEYALNITVRDGDRSNRIADEATFNAGHCYLEAGEVAAGIALLVSVKDRQLSAIAWRKIIGAAIRSPYAWLTDGS